MAKILFFAALCIATTINALFESIVNNTFDTIDSRIGTITGVPGADFSQAEGRVGSGLRLGGTSSIVAENDGIFSADQGSFSVEMWVYVEPPGRQQYLIHHESDKSGFSLYLLDTNELVLGAFFYNQAPFSASIIPLNTSTWSHVGVSFDWNKSTNRGEYFGYLNGIEYRVASSSGIRIITNSSTMFFLGSNNKAEERFNGTMDEVTFYKGIALNETQMQEIYSAGVNGKCLPTSPPTETPTTNPDEPSTEPITTTDVPTIPEVPTEQVCNGDKPLGAECNNTDGVWVVDKDIVIQSTTNIRIDSSIIFQGNVNVADTITFLISSMVTLVFQKCPTFNDTLNIIVTEVSESVHTLLTIPSNCDVTIIEQTTVTTDVEDECNDFSRIETKTKLSILWSVIDGCNDSGLSSGVIAGIAVAVVFIVVAITASLIYFLTFHKKRSFVI